MRTPLASIRNIMAISGALFFTLALTGCGLEGSHVLSATPGSPVASASSPFSGKVHGGPNPIVGARVVLYTTTSNGYGVGSFLQEANQQGASLHQDTDAGGNFQFAGGVTCPAGEFVYLVAYGGNTGANVNNPNSVLLAALGPCSSLYSTTAGPATYVGPFIWASELTTIASAYALNNFISVSGDPVNGFTVGIGAPPTNHAASGCIVNSYYPSCTQTSAAGLAHAFGTATLLVNTTNGSANTTSINGATLPLGMINTLGNVLQACVNTTGGGTSGTGAPTSTTTTSDGTGCGKLFEFTSYAAGATAYNPTNTLSAVLNLAKRPAGSGTKFDTTCTTPGGGTTTTTTCLFNLASAQTFYLPAIAYPYAGGTTSPIGIPDFTLALNYPAPASNKSCPTQSGNGIVYGFGLALDINDNAYFLNADGSGETCNSVLGFGYDGTAIFKTVPDTTGAYKQKTIATDALGHLILTNASSGTVGPAIRVLDATTGNLLASFVPSISNLYYVTIDAQNNIWYNTQNSSFPQFGEYLFSGNHASPSYTAATLNVSGALPSGVSAAGLSQISIDPQGNVWQVSTSTSNPFVSFFPNTGTAASPTYTGTPKYVSICPVAQQTTTLCAGNEIAIGVVADHNGIAWTAPASTMTDLYQITPSGVGNATTLTSALAPGTLLNIPYGHYPAVDGNNNIWVADNGNSSGWGTLWEYDQTNQLMVGGYKGCLPQETASSTQYTTCDGTSNDRVLGGNRALAIDSAGDVWLANASGSNMSEVIGIAAPTWPQLSLLSAGHP